jgi:hypothetical protein
MTPTRSGARKLHLRRYGLQAGRDMIERCFGHQRVGMHEEQDWTTSLLRSEIQLMRALPAEAGDHIRRLLLSLRRRCHRRYAHPRG